MEAFKMTDNVIGFRFGNPVETGVIQGEKTQVEVNLPIELREEGGKTTFTLKLTENDRVYGLGPNLGGIREAGSTSPTVPMIHFIMRIRQPFTALITFLCWKMMMWPLAFSSIFQEE